MLTFLTIPAADRAIQVPSRSRKVVDSLQLLLSNMPSTAVDDARLYVKVLPLVEDEAEADVTL